MTAAAKPPFREYLGNGVTTSFGAPFRFDALSHVAVRLIAVDGVVSDLAYGADYSVAGGATDDGGAVTLAVAPANGVRVQLRRRTPRVQAMNYATADTFPAESHEGAIDKAMLIDQEQDVAIDDIELRAPMVPVGEVAPPIAGAAARANRFDAWGPTGERVYSHGTGTDDGFRADFGDPDIGGRLGAFKLAAGARTRTIDDVLRDQRVSILEFYLNADDGDIAPAIGRAIDEEVGRLMLPPIASIYELKTSVSRVLPFDLDVDFAGQAVTGVGSINLYGQPLTVGALAAPAAAGARSMELTDASALQPGDVVNLQTPAVVATNYAMENKNETVRVLGRTGNVIALSRPLRFAWAPDETGLGLAAWRQRRLFTRDMNYLCPQEQGGAATVRFLYTEGISDIAHVRPRVIGLDDGFETEGNIYRCGGIHYYADAATITDGYYERMSYPFGFYASGIVHETAVGYQNRHTSADLGNWSSSYFGRVDDSGSFSAWSSHMCHLYKISGTCENQDKLPAIRALGDDRSGSYFANDATDDTVESDPGPLEADFQYLWSADHAAKVWHDLELRAPNRTGRSVRVRGARKLVLRNFRTDQREISVYPEVGGVEIGMGCSFGGGVAPQVWNNLTPGTANVHILTSDVRDAYASGGAFHINPRREAAPQSAKTLRCRGNIFRKDGGGVAHEVRVHVNAFFGMNAQFVRGSLTLRATVQHQSTGNFSTVEKDFAFLAYLGGGAVVRMDAAAVATRGPATGSGGENITLTLSDIDLFYDGFGADNYVTFKVTPATANAVLSPNFSVDYILEMQETFA